jgi:hypothetical protein
MARPQKCQHRKTGWHTLRLAGDEGAWDDAEMGTPIIPAFPVSAPASPQIHK